jgi:chromosome segregation ATPase
MTNPPPPLPITPHYTGRAAPLRSAPKTPPAQSPAPQPKPGPVQVLIPACEDDSPDVTTPLTDNATAEDIAAAVGRFRRGAQLAADRAEHGQAEAQKVLEAAQAEVEKIIARAEAEARPLTDKASGDAKRAAQLIERSRLLNRAAQAAVTAERAQADFRALKDERDQLAEKHAELGQRRTALGAERRGLEAQLAAARETGDLDAITTVKARLAAIEDLDGTLQAQQAPMQQRMAELGTGEETFSTHPALKRLPPLASARDHASNRRSEVFGPLNDAFPERPEAVAAAERQRRREQEAYEIGQYYVRQAERAKQTRQQQVILG